MKKQKGILGNIPLGIIIGFASAVLLSLLLSLLITWLIHTDRMEIGLMEPASIIIHCLSAFSGCWIAMSVGKEKLAIISACTMGAMVLFLICVSLTVFSDGLAYLIRGTLTMAASSFAACLLKLKAGAGKRHKKKFNFI